MSCFGIPGFDNLLGQWWGCGPENFAFAANFTLAENVFFGTNPLYQVSDFLAVYPKFGDYAQSILSVAVIPTFEGLNYQVNDVLTPMQQDASGAQLVVTSVGGSGAITGLSVQNGGTGYRLSNGIGTAIIDAQGSGYSLNDVLTLIQAGASAGQVQVAGVNSSGQITAISIFAPGLNYTTATGLSTFGGTGTGATVSITTGTPLSGGNGTGGQVNITGLVAPNLVNNLPLAVIQTYINLASASLVQARWQDTWQIGMNLFVDHFLTLFMRSQGNVGSSAGAIASSGLEKGIMVSSSAGDVSKSIQIPTGLEGFGAWQETSSGVQLITFAKIIGMGPMYFL
jgi:hypothetical protein